MIDTLYIVIKYYIWLIKFNFLIMYKNYYFNPFKLTGDILFMIYEIVERYYLTCKI